MESTLLWSAAPDGSGMGTSIHFAHVAKDPFPIFCELQRYHGASGASLHGHDCLELVYVLRGSGLHRIDGEPFPLIPGDLYAIREGTEHTFLAEGDLLFYNILVKLDLFDARERRELAQLHAFTSFFQETTQPARRPKLSFSPPCTSVSRSCWPRSPASARNVHPAGVWPPRPCSASSSSMPAVHPAPA